MKIFCVGRNYVEHIHELGNAIPENPVIFSKPDTALLKNGEAFYLPDFSSDIHHEAELVIRISKAGKKINKEFAGNYFNEIGLGIDFTARDIQTSLKAKGLPWDLAKGFDGAAPIGEFIDKQKLSSPVLFSLKKNGTIVQEGDSSKMIYDFESLISFISMYFTLKTGDLIFTGTPAGVGAVKKGDLLEGFIEDQRVLEIRVK